MARRFESLDTMDPPVEIALSTGAATCRLDDGCGSTASFRVFATDGFGGVEVSPGLTGRTGPFVVVHGGLVRAVDPLPGTTPGQCFDDLPGHARVAVVAR